MTDYSVVSTRRAYDGVLARVRVDAVRMPNGEVATREVVEHPDAVAVVALDTDDRVVLVRQYRHALGALLWELPAGLLDVSGEQAVDAARRELAEEAGLAAADLRPLLTFRNSAGWTDETTMIYVATGLTSGGPPEGFTAEHEEVGIEVAHVPLGDAVAQVLRGDLTDAKTVIGILAVAVGREVGH